MSEIPGVKETLPVRAIERLTAVAAKTFLPTALTIDTDQYENHPGWLFATRVFEAAEVGGVAAAAAGKPEGAAVFVASRAANLIIDGWMAFRSGQLDQYLSEDLSDERLAVRIPAFLSKCAMKLLPSGISAADVGKFYNNVLLRFATRGVEYAGMLATGAGVALNSPDLALRGLELYALGKGASWATELIGKTSAKLGRQK